MLVLKCDHQCNHYWLRYEEWADKTTWVRPVKQCTDCGTFWVGSHEWPSMYYLLPQSAAASTTFGG